MLHINRIFMEELLVIVICLVLNALFAAYEMAFVSIPKPELRNIARSGDKRAMILVSLRENPERTLSIIQVGITLVGAVAAAVGGVGAAESIEPFLKIQFGLGESLAEILSVLLIVVPLTYFSVVIGELVPKTLALRNPRKIVLAGARWLIYGDRILSPIVSALEWSTLKIISIFFKRAKTIETHQQTSIEIDAFSPVHQRLLLNMADIEKKRIKEILLPWSHVNFLDHTDSIDDVHSVILHSGHTRLPVTSDGNVIGVLHTKEFMVFRESGEKDWLAIIRPSLVVQPTDSALGVLRLLQEKRSHLAIVFSSNFERLGIVTMEDILEEIVGDIFDEDDDGRIRKVFAAKVKSRSQPEEQ
jgi:putative hemolysin